MPRAATIALTLSLAGFSVLGPVGCKQADYAVDMVNRTPQPVYVQLFTKEANGPMGGMGKRLGPGDRAAVGPVRAYVNRGAFVTVDSLGNPGRPSDMDLQPGTNFIQVLQDGSEMNAPLRLMPKQ